MSQDFNNAIIISESFGNTGNIASINFALSTLLETPEFQDMIRIATSERPLIITTDPIGFGGSVFNSDTNTIHLDFNQIANLEYNTPFANHIQRASLQEVLVHEVQHSVQYATNLSARVFDLDIQIVSELIVRWIAEPDAVDVTNEFREQYLNIADRDGYVGRVTTNRADNEVLIYDFFNVDNNDDGIPDSINYNDIDEGYLDGVLGNVLIEINTNDDGIIYGVGDLFRDIPSEIRDQLIFRFLDSQDTLLNRHVVENVSDVNSNNFSLFGFDFRFNQNINDFSNADIIAGGVNELGDIFTITAGELRNAVDAAEQFGIDEDAVVLGAINGEVDRNGPEVTFDLRAGGSAVATSDDGAISVGITPENINDLVFGDFFNDFGLNNLDSIGIEDTFVLNGGGLGMDLPDLTWTDQFTTFGEGYDFGDTLLGSALEAGFDADVLASVGLDYGLGGFDASFTGVDYPDVSWNPNDFGAYNDATSDYYGGLLGISGSNGISFETLHDLGYDFTSGNPIFAVDNFTDYSNYNPVDFQFGFIPTTLENGAPIYNDFVVDNGAANDFIVSNGPGGFNVGGVTSDAGFISPIVLDLDNDGVELEQQADTFFDFDNDGYNEQTTWASADDGFLVIDLNADGTRGVGDGVIDQSKELAFSFFDPDSNTDLQALAEARDENGNLIFDSDGNGVLDANDTIWNELGVWQDQDQDGITDEGELQSLSEIGITSINLGYDDGSSYEQTEDDVTLFGNTLHGLSSFTLNGEIITGGVGDVTLSHADRGWRRVETAIGYTIQFEAGQQINYAELDGTGQADVDLQLLGLDSVTGDDRANVLDASGLSTSVILSGGAGDDTIIGSEAGDLLSGGDGADRLLGGDGDDTLFIDAQDIEIVGGGGNDIAVITSENNETFELSTSDVEVVYGNIGNDVLNAANAENEIILHGGNGDDTLIGGAGDDILTGDDGEDILQGNIGNDTLFGGAGNDTIFAGDGNDVLIGGIGDDILHGGYGSDVYVFERGDGNDQVIESTPPDLLADTIRLEYRYVDYITITINGQTQYYPQNVSVTAYLTDANLTQDYATFNGVAGHGSGTRIISSFTNGLIASHRDKDGFQAIATVTYADGNSINVTFDTLVSDVVGTPDLSNPTTFISSDGVYFADGISINDLTFEVEGNDLKIKVASLDDSPSNDSVTVANWEEDFGGIEYLAFGDGTSLGITQIVNVIDLSEENIAPGGSYTATDDADILSGSENDIEVFLGDGNDLAILGDGDDILRGEDGDDILHGGGGLDALYGGNGNDVLSAGSGNGVDFQYLYGQSGNDTYRINSDNGSVFISATTGEYATSGNADRVVFTDIDLEDITVDYFNFAGTGSSAQGLGLTINWNDGTNSGLLRIGQEGNYIEEFEFADGTVVSSIEIDSSDRLRLYGSDGNDTITGGGNGTQLIHGGNGNDSLSAGSNRQGETSHLYGDEGNDTYRISSDNGYVSISTGGENAGEGTADRVVFEDLNLSDITVNYTPTTGSQGTYLDLNWGSGDDVGRLRIGQEGNYIEEFEFADGTTVSSIALDQYDRFRLHGTDGDDIINGSSVRDLIYGGDGDDSISAGANTIGSWSYLYGQSGDDTYRISSDDGQVFIGNTAETATSGAADRVVFSDINLSDITITYLDYDNSHGNSIYLNWNNAEASGSLRIAHEGEHIEEFEFADGTTVQNLISDTLTTDILEGDEDNNGLFGFDGDDTLNGLAGADYLDGGDGNDILIGGDDDDILTGSSGSDIFEFTTSEFGNDTITDWEDGVDLIDLDALGANFSDITITQNGIDAKINILGDQENTITVSGINASTLDQTDFIL